MCKKSLSAELSGFLSDHVKEVKREVDFLLKEYYGENTPESLEVESFFKEYAGTVSNYLNTKSTAADCSTDCPFVIIRSVVEVQDMDDMETYRYFIVPPYSKDSYPDADNASCLSPLGRALLLKGKNQQVKIEIPTGILRYSVKNITIPEQPVSSCQDVPELAI